MHVSRETRPMTAVRVDAKALFLRWRPCALLTVRAAGQEEAPDLPLVQTGHQFSWKAAAGKPAAPPPGPTPGPAPQATVRLPSHITASAGQSCCCLSLEWEGPTPGVTQIPAHKQTCTMSRKHVTSLIQPITISGTRMTLRSSHKQCENRGVGQSLPSGSGPLCAHGTSSKEPH